jgi:glutathione synthase/RimK-type ligase-like ATP-grasp enzyme
MRIAIHKSDGFAPRWIEYCQSMNTPFKIVNCYDSDIVEQLMDCDALMWHHSHMHSKDILFAKQLLYSVEFSGKIVFPDFKTCWHFDDKVGQKYLFESLNLPLANSYVFYDKSSALNWIKTTSFPKVFKLRGGAGSANVKLVNSLKQAKVLINKAFGVGFSQNDAKVGLKERWRKYRLGMTSFLTFIKGFIRFVYPTLFARVAGKERGYVYFQDFIPNNNSDIRVIVINKKAFAIKRMVRENDFRASGSGNILYDKKLFDENTIQLAFEFAEKLQGQSVALDFVYDNGMPKVVEVSYGFVEKVYDPCVGYWDREMTWHEGKFDPCKWMVDLVVDKIKEKESLKRSF